MDKVITSVTPEDLASRVNSLQYIIYNMIDNTVKTTMIVRVVKVNGDRIDVQNVIQDLDNDGEPIDNFIIPSVRYLKWQYGKNCLDAVPEVGDVGLLLVSKQDTSGLVKNGKSIVQSGGIFNLGDGLYIGGLPGMNEPPTQFLQFRNDVIQLTGTGSITIKSTGDSGSIIVKAKTVNVDATDTTITSTNATVTATNTTLDSQNIKLGGASASKKIALDGDPVKSGATVVGNIVASSVTTSAL